MSKKRTTARAFDEAGGVDDWRVLFWGGVRPLPHRFFR